MHCPNDANMNVTALVGGAAGLGAPRGAAQSNEDTP